MVMARDTVAVWPLLAVMLASGCQKAPTTAARAAKPAAEAPRVAGPLTADESKDLCLADPGGADPLDQALRSHQKKARELPMKSDEWVGVGRQWVRKARIASDPGFYINVDGCAAVALQAEPNFAPALELRSLVLMNDHRFDQARHVAPAAWTFVEAATIFWHLADYDGADAVYAEALRWVPDYPSALVGRARIAIAKEEPRRAIEYLDRAYRMRPLPETAWLLGDA